MNLRRWPVTVTPPPVRYSDIYWNLFNPYDRDSIVGVYSKIESWANGFRNSDHFLVVI